MQFDTLASTSSVEKTKAALEKKKYIVTIAKTGKKALETIKTLIPKNASIMDGASVTLEQIGFVDYLKSSTHPWKNLHAAIVEESDPQKQAQLRKKALLADYYLGSVHAMTETGEFIIASNTGSQLPHLVYSSQNLVLVVSTKKIVPTLEDALKRLDEHVIPLEDERMLKVYNAHTHLSKLVIFKDESPINQRNIHIILVEEDLGF